MQHVFDEERRIRLAVLPHHHRLDIDDLEIVRRAGELPGEPVCLPLFLDHRPPRRAGFDRQHQDLRLGEVLMDDLAERLEVADDRFGGLLVLDVVVSW